MRVHLVSLGCAKNLVDSEVMLGRIGQAGGIITTDPVDAEIIVINTCSFIESATNESIDTILELSKFKQKGTCQKIIVTGCLPERYREQIVSALPEVDLFLGTGAYDQIIAAVTETTAAPKCLLPDPDHIAWAGSASQRLISTGYMAYIKIAEGCDRDCTYCIIPKLRGRQKSRSADDILAEARGLMNAGIKELNLVAQDTSHYGHDLTPPENLARLLDRLAGLSDAVWIRFLYGHPESMNSSIVQTIAAHSNLCSYYDIPVQHASSRILKRMGRRYTRQDLLTMFDNIRQQDPEAALRTTVIVGFPGETDADFKKLVSFVESVRFDHVGVFTYSDASDLASHRLGGHVSAAVAQSRYKELMARQKKLSLENNRKHAGRVLSVLVETQLQNGQYIGRSTFQAPEVDGVTYIDGNSLTTGAIIPVKITKALDYDLVGEPV